MDKEKLISRKYVILKEIDRITEILEEDPYNKIYNSKLSVMAKQLSNINKAVHAY
jgi:hypothetical protein